jgi:hypothetical protein
MQREELEIIKAEADFIHAKITPLLNGHSAQAVIAVCTSIIARWLMAMPEDRREDQRQRFNSLLDSALESYLGLPMNGENNANLDS